MSGDVAEAKPPPAASNEDAEALLDTANSGSQHVTVLHVAFMALCAYVLVIVFGTTDMDLLIGKGVQLPVVDVSVPIVGFYWFAPYLVVLVHFNLLLQLQLLSRQLYAFDAAAPEEERIGGLRDRLHIFPFTYYLVGRPGPIVRRWLGFVVGITLLVLPLATLLVLQLRFLAYQDQTVTWWQRVAVWIDVALVIALWPLIMDRGDDRGDSWRNYLSEVGDRLRQRWRIGLAWAAVWGIVFLTFVTPTPPYSGEVILGLLILLGVARGLTGLWRRWRGRRRKPEGTGPARTPPAVRGMPGLLLVVALGVPLPLGLFALGEWGEEELQPDYVVDSGLMTYDRFRFLDLSEQVLLARPARPELIAQFREGNPEKVKEALKQVEPVNLQGRNLRRASLFLALLPAADLRQANLQSANLIAANLQSANLEGAKLQGAALGEANLQGAYLGGAQLQGADLQGTRLQGAAQLQGTQLHGARLQGAQLGANLQGAYLWDARLQGADLTNAGLQGAYLKGAHLQGADLTNAELQGAYLKGAHLQGADLTNAGLQGADLRFARLYGVVIETGRAGLVEVETSGTALVDLRAASWTPLHEKRLAEIRKVLGKTVADKSFREKALDRIERAGHADLAPPTLESCLIDPEVTPERNCEQKWLPAEKEAFQRELFPVLEKLACTRPKSPRP